MKFAAVELEFLLQAVDVVRSATTQQANLKGSLLLRLSAELERSVSGADNGVDSDSSVSDE